MIPPSSSSFLVRPVAECTETARWPLALLALAGLLVSGGVAAVVAWQAWNAAAPTSPRTRGEAASVRADPVPGAPIPVAAPGVASAPVPDALSRFALNALLVPLLDDTVPLRWSDSGVAFFCGAETAVSVDGRPMQPNAPLPSGPFRVRWQMDACRPLGPGSIELSGAVELRVTRDGDTLRAMVLPEGLLVRTATGVARLQAPFHASTALGR